MGSLIAGHGSSKRRLPAFIQALKPILSPMNDISILDYIEYLLMLA